MMQATCKTVTRFEVDDLEACAWLSPDMRCQIRRLVLCSAMWTGRVDGQVVAICGITEIHPHYAKAWSYLTRDAVAHRIWLHRATKRILHNWIRASEYWRVEADCLVTNLPAHNWLRHLGFQREGELPLAGQMGEGMTRYAMFPRGILG